MKQRNLGRGGPLVSPIGIGAMSFSNFFGPVDPDRCYDVLRASVDWGVDHLDTSNVYGMGQSETIIGTFLKENFPKGPCPFTIATKAGIKRNIETGERSFDNSAEHLMSELDASLSRLGVEAVDLFYVHRRDPSVEIEEVTETLAAMQQSGKIRSFGYSEIAPSSLRRANRVAHVGAVQSEYSLATRNVELGLIQACAELGAALVAFSPVSRGLLTETPPSLAIIADNAFLANAPRFQEPRYSENLAIVRQLQELAADMGTSTPALAIAWLMRQGDHVIPIPGTRSVDHLRQLVDGAELDLTDDDLARIDAVMPVGWAHGDRYSETQWIGPERFS